MNTINTLLTASRPRVGSREEKLSWGRLGGLTSFEMRLTLSYMMEAWFRQAGPLGVKPSEFALLSMIEVNPNVSALALSQALNIALPNMVAMVGKLARQELVLRCPDALDRRRQLLTLTQAGHDLVATVGEAVVIADKAITSKLAPGDLHKLNQLMTDLRA